MSILDVFMLSPLRLAFHRGVVRMLPPQLFEMRQSVRGAGKYCPGRYRNQAYFARRDVLQAWTRLGCPPYTSHFGHIWSSHSRRCTCPQFFLRRAGYQRLQTGKVSMQSGSLSMTRNGTCYGQRLSPQYHFGLVHRRI